MGVAWQHSPAVSNTPHYDHALPLLAFEPVQAVRSLRESVDLSRLSRIALSNLEKDEAAADYTAAQPATAGGDITIDSTDAELDFEEVQEQGECAVDVSVLCNPLLS